MATQMQMIQALIDKIEKQAKHTALIDWEIAHLKKESADWQHRALKAEAKLADQVEWEISSQNNYEAYREQLARATHAFRLLERVEQYKDGLFSLTPQTGSLILEIAEFLRPGSVPDDLLPEQPTDAYDGLVEYKEAVSNGR